jgi:hypothetical protein
MPGLGSCRDKSANLDAVWVLRHVPRHDMNKTQQVKMGDFAPHGGKLPPNSSDFALHGAKMASKQVRFCVLSASSTDKIRLDHAEGYLAKTRYLPGLDGSRRPFLGMTWNSA